MRIKALVWLLLCSSLISIQAQNIVPNGSFELKRGRKATFKPWRFINTVDYYNIKGGGKRPLDSEKWNLPEAQDGVCYVGIRIYPKYREFIQVKLTEKLEEGQKYYFEMWVSWGDHSSHYAKRLGASFYHKKPAYTSDYYIFKNPPQLELKQYEGICQDSVTWMKISGVYRAKGGERYLSIGNFSTTPKKDRLAKKNWYTIRFARKEAYYFVDNVSLQKIIEVQPVDSMIAQEADTNVDFKIDNYVYNIEKDSSIVINNLVFETASDRIMPSSYRDLELVLEYLNENPNQHIQIIGHTDNVGSDADNQKLSEKRAKSVYKYFLNNHISKDRIFYVGFGEKHPIADNETSQGRKQNRRVELKIIDNPTGQ
jgi:outer membrane protein OmpA-like peptidoglycan-associated protein